MQELRHAAVGGHAASQGGKLGRGGGQDSMAAQRCASLALRRHLTRKALRELSPVLAPASKRAKGGLRARDPWKTGVDTTAWCTEGCGLATALARQLSRMHCTYEGARPVVKRGVAEVHPGAAERRPPSQVCRA